MHIWPSEINFRNTCRYSFPKTMRIGRYCYVALWSWASDVASNYGLIDCFFNSLFGTNRSEISTLRIPRPLWGNSPVGSPNKGQVMHKAFPETNMLGCDIEADNAVWNTQLKIKPWDPWTIWFRAITLTFLWNCLVTSKHMVANITNGNLKSGDLISCGLDTCNSNNWNPSSATFYTTSGLN